MKIHYMDCATMHPRGAGLFIPQTSRTPSLCLQIDDKNQLVLVNSGFRTLDMRDPSRMGPTNMILNALPPLSFRPRPALGNPRRLFWRTLAGLGLHPRSQKPVARDRARAPAWPYTRPLRGGRGYRFWLAAALRRCLLFQGRSLAVQTSAALPRDLPLEETSCFEKKFKSPSKSRPA